MSQDASSIQVIEKFSFIYTLTRSSDRDTNQLTKQVSVEVQECTDNSHDEPCHKIVHSSSLESVTLSSVLGFPNLALTNGASLNALEGLVSNYSLDLAEPLELSAEDRQNKKFIVRHLGKIVFALSSSYLIFVGWWLAGHHYYGRLFPFSALRAVINISGQEIAASDLQFIDYMERSLANIEGNQAIGISNSPNQQGNEEVVYVPVYNLTQTNSSSSINSSPLTFPFHSSANNVPLPIPMIPPPPPIKSPQAALKPAPIISRQLPQAKPTLPSSLPPSARTKVSSHSHLPPSTIKDYTLLGVLELGKRSAALFKVDGVTKRIWVGEALDYQDWILDSVTNQKAKLTRQGETRSLSVGEKF